jgi:periplasmic divalent cation tolerance protein
MKQSQCRVVLVTCGKLSEARRIAHAAVKNGLAACVNVSMSPVESVYRWKGKTEVAREYVLIFKTTIKGLAGLERLVQRMHSYDVPEFIVLPIVAGSKDYLKWLAESVRKAKRQLRSSSQI